jgi:hypothetical protein
VLISDDLERRRFFQRPVELVREDIDYSLATAVRIIERKRIQEEIAREVEKQEKIDSEIEKTKQEIEEIEKSE